MNSYNEKQKQRKEENMKKFYDLIYNNPLYPSDIGKILNLHRNTINVYINEFNKNGEVVHKIKLKEGKHINKYYTDGTVTDKTKYTKDDISNYGIENILKPLQGQVITKLKFIDYLNKSSLTKLSVKKYIEVAENYNIKVVGL